MRKQLICGNWKMNQISREAKVYFEAFNDLKLPEGREAVIFAPFTLLDACREYKQRTPLLLGAQNMYFEDEGAFTGEISPVQLKDLGVTHVLVGHSERRHVFHEPDAFIHKKVKFGLVHGLNIILCVGETKEQREQEKMQDVLKEQLSSALEGVKEPTTLHIAYEPVWAIGTGLTATPEQAEEAHAYIREFLHERYGAHAKQMCIIYGGSVNPENAKQLMEQKNVDGLLVGGASLNPEKFRRILLFDR